ncbi:MAG TPA: copper chaperone PCu(A)C [Microthrixaceae bacterium]|nr:copper chaperone PCu(A)C [Microthrixaceae bacterium]HNI35205.1 copper chaperone PCu(A)C [Microthrixaceae bacterium]
MTPRPHRARVGALSFAVSLALVGLPACGEDDTASEDTSTTESAPTSAATETTEATASAPTISDVWARTSPSGVDRGAAYMVITGGEADDELTGAAVSTEIAAKTEVHEVVMADSSMPATSMGGGGMETTMPAAESTTPSMDGDAPATTTAPAMEMREVASIKIPAGEQVALAPGGYHVMFMGLVKPFVVGETFDLTLTFAKAGDVTVTVEVKDAP